MRRSRAPYEAADVQAMVGKLFAGRVVYHDGTAELAPGITLHRVGGHTRGLQVVRVHTQRGYVVLASDAAHFYANWQQRRPFPIVDDVAAYLDAFATIESLASSPQHIIPGHDPLVLSALSCRRARAWPMPCACDLDPIALKGEWWARRSHSLAWAGWARAWPADCSMPATRSRSSIRIRPRRRRWRRAAHEWPRSVADAVADTPL